ncbi:MULTISPECIES: NAD(P)-dependent oxidoreductase [Peribacillus]|uniref:NAD-dependent epimerase/dehydratase family protein n=1 Tax=Peribacillus TaxID=2675229 RepID=UPI0020422174|nr:MULTISPECIES: NAD-dependent epimerase/dehydratase [Peribacillus]MCM3677509.1 NAD-dependent epimerase/dehydratase [Peribacillus simplex]MDQ0883815.1 CDP-paratose synthetase [Peribacillus sp. V2I11]
MRVLVTGATGFLGSFLVKTLVKEGYEVIILKRSFSNSYRIAKLTPHITMYNLDEIDLEIPFQDSRKIDAVIHTATCYGRNNESIREIVEANLIFPLQLLEMAVSYKTRLFINTDTFSNINSISNYLINYNLSKKTFLEWGKVISIKKKINFINVKLEHLYGPFDDHSQKFVPYIINSCLKNVPEVLLTPGEQKRDFIYVDDAVSAYLTLLQKGISKSTSFFEEFELGTGKETSIREFVELAHKITKSKTILKFGSLPYRDDEIMFSKANIEPLTSLGWSSKIKLIDGIKEIVKQVGREVN